MLSKLFSPAVYNYNACYCFTIAGAGVWAVYPVIFSVSYFCGVFHCTLTAILSIITILSFYLAAFRPAGTQANVQWGSYPVVGKGSLENYTFCLYCGRPKSPRSHHCRSCKICVLDMDHHCPFVSSSLHECAFFLAFGICLFLVHIIYFYWHELWY